MTFLFLMDPLETVVTAKDTSFVLMLGARRKGHRVFYLPHDGITLKNGKLSFDVLSVVPQDVADQPFISVEPQTLSQDDVDAVFIRSDPPFDGEYLVHTWLLEQLPEHIPVINDPNGIRTANEKIWATQFTSIVPRTLITRKKNVLLSFLKEEKSMILKPTDSYGGSSIFFLRDGDPNLNVILEILTGRWTTDVIAQQYIPDAEHGDKRILLLNGEPLGAVLRVHASGDHRNNFFAGGKAAPAQITARDREIIDHIKPSLRKLGLYFVGIDIIGAYLIEVNVTSPTGLREINHFNKTSLEDRVIEFTENRVGQKGK